MVQGYFGHSSKAWLPVGVFVGVKAQNPVITKLGPNDDVAVARVHAGTASLLHLLRRLTARSTPAITTRRSWVAPMWTDRSMAALMNNSSR
jgi:hypothetical protein